MEENKEKKLIDKYLSGQASEQEKAAVETWFNTWSEEKKGEEISDYVEMNERIMAGLPEGSILRRSEEKSRTWKWLPYAAAVLLLASMTFYIYEQNEDKKLKAAGQLAKIEDLNPGTKRATLTLADGKTIILDTAFTGTLANLDGIRVSKTVDGQLIYENDKNGKGTAQNNIVNIPRGGEYQLILPDGTKVWLNAQTTIEYPSRFIGRERKVKIKGEAYFEVAKDPRHPFVVESSGQTVQVLGTHFNVDTYNTQTITTLAEGSIRVSSLRGTKQSLTLKPGQQSVNGQNLTIEPADLESSLAWKNGLLYFKDAPLTEVLDEISRWYDVDVEYKSTASDKVFSGGVDRTSKLSSMLKILRLTGVKATLEVDGRQRKLVIE